MARLESGPDRWHIGLSFHRIYRAYVSVDLLGLGEISDGSDTIGIENFFSCPTYAAHV